MKAAAKYEVMYGFKMRWYLCDECSYYHIATVTHKGDRVLSMDAIRRSRGN